MSTPTRGRLLISHITLRGPEVEQLFALLVERGTLTYEALAAEMVPTGSSRASLALEQAALDEALSFLVGVGMVAQEGSLRRRATFHPLKMADTPFSLHLLHRLLVHWEARQRAIQRVYQEAVAGDHLAITPRALRAQMERGPYQALCVWTGEKITFWSQLMAHVGLVRRLERGEECLIVPQPDLVRSALAWAQMQVAEPTSLDACLRCIDQALFACFTARGYLHQGLAQTLVALHRVGRVQLGHQADAARSHRLGSWRVSHLKMMTEDRTL
jgi:hypothetical protein